MNFRFTELKFLPQIPSLSPTLLLTWPTDISTLSFSCEAWGGPDMDITSPFPFPFPFPQNPTISLFGFPNGGLPKPAGCQEQSFCSSLRRQNSGTSQLPSVCNLYLVPLTCEFLQSGGLILLSGGPGGVDRILLA